MVTTELRLQLRFGENVHSDASSGNYAPSILLSLYLLTKYTLITFTVYNLALDTLRVIRRVASSFDSSPSLLSNLG